MSDAAVETRLALLVCSRYAQGADWNDVSAAVTEAAEFTESATPIPALDAKECQDLFWRVARDMSKHIGSLTQAADSRLKRKSAYTMVRILRDRRETQIKQSIEVIDKAIFGLKADAKLLESNKKKLDLDAIKQRIKAAMLDAGFGEGVSSAPSSAVSSPKHMDVDIVRLDRIDETEATEEPAVMENDSMKTSQLGSESDYLQDVSAEVRRIWDDIASHVYVQELMRNGPFSATVLLPRIRKVNNVQELFSLLKQMISDFRHNSSADDENLSRVISLEDLLNAKHHTTDAYKIVNDERNAVNGDDTRGKACETLHESLKSHGVEATGNAKGFHISESSIASPLRGGDNSTQVHREETVTPKGVSSPTSMTPARKRPRSSVVSSTSEHTNQIDESETEDRDIVHFTPLSSENQTPQSSVPNSPTTSKKALRKSKRPSIIPIRRTPRRRSSSAADASSKTKPILLPKRGSARPPFSEDTDIGVTVDFTEQSISPDDAKEKAVEVVSTMFTEETDQSLDDKAIQKKKTRGTRQQEICMPEDLGSDRSRRVRRQSSAPSEAGKSFEKEPEEKGRPHRKEEINDVDKSPSGTSEQSPADHNSEDQASFEIGVDDDIKPGKRKRNTRKVAQKPKKVRASRASAQASNASLAATRPRRTTSAKKKSPAKRGRRAKS